MRETHMACDIGSRIMNTTTGIQTPKCFGKSACIVFWFIRFFRSTSYSCYCSGTYPHMKAEMLCTLKSKVHKIQYIAWSFLNTAFAKDNNFSFFSYCTKLELTVIYCIVSVLFSHGQEYCFYKKRLNIYRFHYLSGRLLVLHHTSPTPHDSQPPFPPPSRRH